MFPPVSKPDIRKSFHMVSVIFSMLLCITIYSNSTPGPFVFDDLPNIRDNRSIRTSDLNVSSLYKAAFKSPLANRPVSYISFALNYYFGKYGVTGYHIINTIIHLINGLLVYALALRIFRYTACFNNKTNKEDRGFIISLMALFSACIFIAHPIQTQSVVYIVQRMNSLAALFYLASLLLYILGRETQVRRDRYLFFSGSLVSGILALGSKEIAATLPACMYLYEWYFVQDLNKDWLKRNIKYLIFLMLLSIVIVMVFLGIHPIDRILTAYDNRMFTPGERLLTECRVIVFYLSLIVLPVPSRLNLLHEFSVSHTLFEPVTTLFSLLFLTFLIGFAVYSAKKYRLISFCIFWFFFNLVIESSVIGLELVFEHRLYLPMVGVSLAISYLIFNIFNNSRFTTGACCFLLIMLLGAGTYARNKVWADATKLWSDVISKNPDSHRAHLNLGNILKRRGSIEEAIFHYRKAIDIYPYYTKAHNNLGMLLKKQGKLQAGMEHYRLAIQFDPANAQAHFNLGIALVETGRLDEAIVHYRRAIEINPGYTKAHYNLGNVLGRQGKFAEAEFHYQKAIELQPEKPHGYNNLGIILAGQGKLDEAIEQFSRAVQIQPDYLDAYFNLGKAQLLKGDQAAACTNYTFVYNRQPYFHGVNKILRRYCNQDHLHD